MHGNGNTKIDPWVCSTQADRLILRAAEPLPLQLDLFDQRPITDTALRWLGLALRAVNQALPVLTRRAGTCPAPLPVQDLIDYVREDRWPEPTDAATRVPDCAWKLLWPVLEPVAGRPTAVRAADQQRICAHLQAIADYAMALQRLTPCNPATQQIGLAATPLTPMGCKSCYPKPIQCAGETLTQADTFGVLRAARAQFLARLAQPITALSDNPDEARVHFAGVLVYVADRRQRDLYVRILDGYGDFNRHPGTYDLYHPLCTDYWLEVFVDHWLWRRAAQLPRAPRGFLRAWLLDCLRCELNRLKLRPLLRRALQRAFAATHLFDPAIARLACQALPPCREHALLACHYVQTWQDHETLLQIHRETPTLLNVYQWARRNSDFAHGSTLGDLKHYLHEWGVSQRGWNLLCRHGVDFYREALRAPALEASLATITQHVVLFQQVAHHECPPRALQRALYAAHTLPRRSATNIPSRFIRHAWDALLEAQRQGRSEAFLRDEFMPVLWWLRWERPALDKNQLRAGWPFWQRAHRDWENRRRAAQTKPWLLPIPPESIEFGPHIAFPLCSMSQLLEEGDAMHHCVADYAQACAEGRYLVFSIRERWGGKRAATFGLMLGKGDCWVMDQFRAFANADVARCLWPIARYVHNHVNTIASRQLQLQHAA